MYNSASQSLNILLGRIQLSSVLSPQQKSIKFADSLNFTRDNQCVPPVKPKWFLLVSLRA